MLFGAALFAVVFTVTALMGPAPAWPCWTRHVARPDAGGVIDLDYLGRAAGRNVQPRARAAQAVDREMREVGLEPVMGADQGVEGVRLLERERVVAAAPVAREVHVRGLLGAVVFGAGLQVGVLEDPDLLQQRERPVHGGGVDARHLALDLAGDGRGGDVPGCPHHLGHDGPPLRGHAQALAAQQLHDVAVARSRDRVCVVHDDA